MGLVTDAVIKAKGRVTKETTKMIEIRNQGLHVAQMTIIRMDMTAETTDAVIIAMIVQMNSEMGMTQTVHPDVSGHDDSDQEPQGRIVTLKREVKALKAVATTKRSMVTTLPLLKRPTKYTTNMRYSSVLGCILTNSLAARLPLTSGQNLQRISKLSIHQAQNEENYVPRIVMFYRICSLNM